MNPISPYLAALTAWLRAKPTDERGFQMSVENLLWIIGIVGLVGIVLAVLNGYIQGLLGSIGGS